MFDCNYFTVLTHSRRWKFLLLIKKMLWHTVKEMVGLINILQVHKCTHAHTHCIFLCCMYFYFAFLLQYFQRHKQILKTNYKSIQTDQLEQGNRNKTLLEEINVLNITKQKMPSQTVNKFAISYSSKHVIVKFCNCGVFWPFSMNMMILICTFLKFLDCFSLGLSYILFVLWYKNCAYGSFK